METGKPALETWDDEDIPVLDASMLHTSIDFERGMSWCPPVTITLIVVCVVVFVFEVATGALTDDVRMQDMGALSAPPVANGEIWRLLSAPFLHASPDHIMGNLLILFILGLACEHAFGSSQFVFLFVVAAIGGSCASLFNDNWSVGASGAIFGLAGVLIGLFRRHHAVLHLRDHRIGIVIAAWAAYQILLGFLSPQIDNLAHVGGFGTGLILGMIVSPALLHHRADFSRRLSVNLMLALGCTALIATSVCFVPRLAT